MEVRARPLILEQAMSKPFPGVVRITSDGIGHSTKIDVLGEDGNWHPIRCATAVQWSCPGPEEITRADVKMEYVQVDVIAAETTLRVPPLGRGLAPPRSKGRGVSDEPERIPPRGRLRIDEEAAQ
jgi:hypothetical protein